MNVEKAASNALAYLGDFTSVRGGSGTTPEHASWMLEGIVSGYVQHEKAHRWLGYAQAIIVTNQLATLDNMKRSNKAAPDHDEIEKGPATDGN